MKNIILTINTFLLSVILILAFNDGGTIFAMTEDGENNEEQTFTMHEVKEKPKGYISFDKVDQDYPIVSCYGQYVIRNDYEGDVLYFIDSDGNTIFETKDNNKDFIVKYQKKAYINEKIYNEIYRKAVEGPKLKAKIYKVGDEVSIYGNLEDYSDMIMSIDSISYTDRYEGITLNDYQYLCLINFSIHNESNLKDIIEKCFKKVETSYGETKTGIGNGMLMWNGKAINCLEYDIDSGSYVQNEDFIIIDQTTVAFKLDKNDKVKYIHMKRPFYGSNDIRVVDVAPELSAKRIADSWIYRTVQFDNGVYSTERENTIDVRVTADLTKSATTFDANELLSSTCNDTARRFKAKFDELFNNVITVINMKHSGNYSMIVKVAVKISVENADNLCFYSYDETTNKCKLIKNANAKIDKNGYLHFDTNIGGNIIISEGPLKKK